MAMIGRAYQPLDAPFALATPRTPTTQTGAPNLRAPGGYQPGTAPPRGIVPMPEPSPPQQFPRRDILPMPEPSPLPGPITPDASPTPTPPAAPNYRTRGAYSHRLGPWGGASDKWAQPWDQMSERYRMLSVLSHFDPSGGITPDVLNALNGADIYGAKFSGAGDKLNVQNAGNWSRFGTGGEADVIGNFNSGNPGITSWYPWEMATQGATPQPTTPTAPPTPPTPGQPDVPTWTEPAPQVPQSVPPEFYQALMTLLGQPQSPTASAQPQAMQASTPAQGQVPQALRLLAQGWGGQQAAPGMDPMTQFLLQQAAGGR